MTRQEIELGMGPLGYQPPDRKTDAGMSLAPKGFEAAVIRARDPFTGCEPCYLAETQASITSFYQRNPQAVRNAQAENPEYDVTVRRGSYGHYDVTARSENAQKLLGKGTFTYEDSEWKKLNRELRNYTYTIEVR